MWWGGMGEERRRSPHPNQSDLGPCATADARDVDRMRLGLIIERKNYYRLLAPVVEAALSRGWEVVCLHDHAQPRTGFKGYEFPDAGIVPSFRSGRPRVEIYQGAAALRDAIVRADVGAVVSLGLPPEPMRSEPATRPAAWVTLQYHAELFSWLAPPGVLSVDALGIYSTWWLDTAADYFVREGVMTSGSAMERQLRNRAAVVGF